MDALREGADAQKAVRLDSPLAPVEGRGKREFVTWEEAFKAWWGADGESVAELKAKGPDSQQLNQDSKRLFQVRWGVLKVPKSSSRAHRGVHVWVFGRQLCQYHT